MLTKAKQGISEKGFWKVNSADWLLLWIKNITAPETELLRMLNFMPAFDILKLLS